jgi:hypothetical protein
MATRIIEYATTEAANRRTVVPQASVVQSAMTATTTSAQSAAFGDGTNMILVQSDEAIYVRVGNNPTATTDNYKIQAGGEQFFSAGAGQKVAIRS